MAILHKMLIPAALVMFACEATTDANADGGVGGNGEGGSVGGSGGSVVGGTGGEVGGTGGDTGGTVGGGGGEMGGGGGAGGAVVEPPPPHVEGGASWTFLVYMVADTNLEYDALNDLQEMAAVGSGEGFNIIVQADRAADYTSDGVLNLPDWEQTLRLKVDQDSLQEIEDIGEVNMGDPATLSDFISWGIAQYPADRYALIFWDHGGGWIGFGDDESADHDLLGLPEIQEGIANGIAGTDVDRFALVGFDACLMSTWETGVTLEYQAEYMIASEELEPGHGWDYHALQILKDTPASSPVDLGGAIIDGFISQSTEYGTVPTVTLALTDLVELHQLTAAIQAFHDVVMPGLADMLNTIGLSRANVEEYGPLVDPRAVTNMVDIADLMGLLAEADPALADVQTQIDAALAAVVLRSENGDAHARSHGLSIFFPSYPEYYSPGYDVIDGIEPWRAFIKAFHNGGEGVPAGAVPDFVEASPTATVEVIDEIENLVLVGNLTEESAGNVSRATVYYGVTDESGAYLFGDSTAINDDTGLVTGVWDLSAMYVAQGDTMAYCYLSLEDRGDTLFATIPFVYVSGADQLLTVMAFAVDSETGDILSLDYYAQTGEGWAELSNFEEGALLYPLIQTPGANGLEFVQTSEVGFDVMADDFAIDFLDLDVGTPIIGALEAINFANQGDLIVWQGER